MPCLITALTKLVNNETVGKKQTTKWAKTKTFCAAEIEPLKLKAHSNKVEIQSDKTLTTQIGIFVNTKQIGLYTN